MKYRYVLLDFVDDALVTRSFPYVTTVLRSGDLLLMSSKGQVLGVGLI